MAMRPGSRPPVGSAAWCTDERSSALEITRSEVEEFSYSARNELEWLNEHMSDIFSENQMYVFDASNNVIWHGVDTDIVTLPTFSRLQENSVGRHRGPRAS